MRDWREHSADETVRYVQIGPAALDWLRPGVTPESIEDFPLWLPTSMQFPPDRLPLRPKHHGSGAFEPSRLLLANRQIESRKLQAGRCRRDDLAHRRARGPPGAPTRTAVGSSPRLSSTPSSR